MPVDKQNIPLQIVDGLQLGARYREILRPGETVTVSNGMEHALPQYFYEVDSYETAKNTRLAAHFSMHEFLETDYKEADILQSYPKYVPVSITLTAAILELFRKKVGTFVRIATNGGYRSPQHALNSYMSPHCWGTAVNIYKIGSQHLDSKARIEKYSAMIGNVLPGVWVRSYGTEPGTVFDQLHMDLGYTTVSPHGIQEVIK